MSCPMMKMRYEPIADEIVDKSLQLYPNHTAFTHLGCVALRVIIGAALIHPSLPNHGRQAIIIVLLLSILLFGFKYSQMFKSDTIYWKSYLRMIVSYSTALYLLSIEEDKSAGLIVIADAIIALQARHTASALSCGIKK